jgi:choice-of-anchor B domain-containing protein
MSKVLSNLTFVLAIAGATILAPPARAQLSRNVILHSQLDEHSQYADIWGYTDPGGDEYALVCTTFGLSVINVSDPKNPYETGFVPGPVSTWQDVKTYQSYAYFVNESSGGLAIVDLSDPENPVSAGSWTGSGFHDAHNLYIEESTGRAYIAGSENTGGVRIVSLANPTSPVQVGQWNTAYFHDVYVQDNVLYGAAIYVDTLYLLDVSDPANVTILGSVGNYPGAFTHNVWATPDGDYCMTTDEQVGSRCIMWDVSNPANIVQTDDYVPNPNTIPHNAIIEGGLAFISHYTIGVRIVDVSNPFDIVEVGYYDTNPTDNSGNFRGCWGVYPFFQTSPNLIVASDFTRGLFVLEYKGTLGALQGAITDAASAQDVTHATVEIVSTGNTAAAAEDGSGYFIEDSPGPQVLRVEAFGYLTSNTGATISPDSTTTLDVALTPEPGGVVNGTVRDEGTGVPIANAKVEVITTPWTETTNGTGQYATTNLPVGTHTVRAWAFGYNAMDAVVNIGNGSSLTADFALNPAFLTDDFEAASGWSVSGTASAGQWERADPQPTSDHLGPVQTGSDHTPPPGTHCWVTGPLAGAGIGTYDVDGGQTLLMSPVFDLTGLPSPRVRYSRWYVSGVLFTPTTDVWDVHVSSNAGATWTTIESVEFDGPGWVDVDVAIDSFVAPTDQVQFRFTAQDTADGSITEAAVDDFTIYNVDIHDATSSPGIGALASLKLGPMMPNPLRRGATGTISLLLPTGGRVLAEVYDVTGRRVARLARGVFPGGAHTIRWDGASGNGTFVPTGVYFIRLQVQGEEHTRKVLVLR